MNTDSNSSDAVMGASDLGELFAQHWERLRRMVHLRLDRRLNGRVDASDVIQDAYLEASRRFHEYERQQDVSPFVWLRFLTSQKLAQAHRYHLGTQARDAGREVSINAAAGPEASSAALAAQWVGRLSSPRHARNRAEQRHRIQQALNEMEDVDREILALRHFEHLDNAESAEVLGIEKQASYKRYIRAIRRLKQFLDTEEKA